MTQKGTLFIVSGPSGSGKSTLCAEAVKEIPNMRYSISYTSRSPRAGEQHGIHYLFVGTQEFQQLIAQGALLEWAQVYGHYYGTHRRQVESLQEQGYDVIMDIDVQGARLLQQACPDAVLIFIFPPSLEILRERITRRSLDTEETIRRRMQVAQEEMAAYDRYQYLIVNDELEKAKLELKSIIIAHRCRLSGRKAQAQRILKHLP